MKGIILAAIAAIASPAAAAEQFDLVCSGTVKRSISGRADPYEMRYRIDTTARSWCSGACAEVRPIQSIETGQLVLQEHEPAFGDDVRVRLIVNRNNGAWEDYYVIPGRKVGATFIAGSRREAAGTCTKTEFSGFPTPKF